MPAPLTVGVSGINAVDNPGPGVGVARSLREAEDLDLRIVGLAYDAMEPGIYMDWLLDRSFVVPYPSAGRDAYIERLRYIQSVAGLDFIIPTLDTEMPFYSRCQGELETLGMHCFVPTPEMYRLRGKDRLTEVAETIGIELPETEVVSSQEELVVAVEKVGLPVMIKGAFYQARRAHTTQEALQHCHRIVAEWGYPIIVQQVVSGDELNVVAVGDGVGGCLGRVAIRKMWITELGKMWTGVTIHNQAILRASDAFARAYRWRGPFELECIASAGRLYLVEINPRFPAWCYFATGVGLNLPGRMITTALGGPLSAESDYPAGRLFIRYTYELVTRMEQFQRLVIRGETAEAQR